MASLSIILVKVEKRKRKAPTSMDSYRSRSSMES